MAQNPFFALDGPQQSPVPMPSSTVPADNPFSLLDTFEEEQKRKMKAAQAAARKTTPEQAAEDSRLAKQTGVSRDVVAAASPEARAQMQDATIPYDAIRAQSPTTAEWSTKPENAAVAKDDMANMGFIEWVVKAPGRAFAQQVNSYRYAEIRYKELLGQTLTQEERDRMNSYKYHSTLGGELGVGDNWWARAIPGAGRLLAQGIEPAKYAAAGAVTTGAIGAAGGSVVPGAGTLAGATGGALLGAKSGAYYGRVKSEAIQESVGIADELADVKDEHGNPLDPQVIQAAALVGGALAGGLGVVGLNSILKRTPGLDKIAGAGKGELRKLAIKEALKSPTVRRALVNLVKNYSLGMVEQVGEEVAQRAVEITAQELAKAASGDQFNAAQRSMKDIGADLANEAINAIPEFALGIGGGPVLHLAREAQRAQVAQNNVALFNAIAVGATESKTLQRLPEAFRDFVEKTTEDGPIKDTYAPVDTWRTYWQTEGVDPAAMATEITGRADALEVAEREGGLRIPTADYAAKIAGTKHNAFFSQELRLGSPDAMNGRESTEFIATMKEQAKQLVAAAKAETPQGKILADIVGQVEKQLVEAGVPRETSRTQAQTLAGVAVAHGRAGFDPYQALRRYGFTVERRLSSDDFADGQGAVTFVQAKPPGQLDPAVPGLAGLEASIGGATILPGEVGDGTQVNASGESGASLEALSRAEGMRAGGKTFVVYDRAGRRRVLLGPDAVDYVAQKGETYGVEGPEGFELRTDNGGRLPTGAGRPTSALGRGLRRTFGQVDTGLAPVPASVKVEGPVGPANAQGIAAKFIGYQEGWAEAGIPTIALYNVVGGELDGSTVDIERLHQNDIPVPPTPPLLEYNQSVIARQPALIDWFGNSVVVDEDGQPLVVFHGTTQTFNTFDTERANIESDLGRGFYFSNNPEDTAENYAAIGPDLQGKIERRTEQLADERGVRYDDPQARADATAELVAQGGLTVPVFLKMENPAVLGGKTETQLTYELVEDEEGDIVSEGGTLVTFIESLRTVADTFYDAKVDDAIARLLEEGIDGVGLSKVVDILKADEGLAYATDDNGNLAVNEIIRAALEETGFDGIIDHTVDVKFGSQRRLGKQMSGMDSDTTHFVAFKPTQIKSAIGNRGTFDPLAPNILYQMNEMLPPAGEVYFSKLERALDALKQGKATGAQWKASIKGAKIGVSRDEFALARMEDLDDAKVYTRDELIAYIRTNKPTVDSVTLGDGIEDGKAEPPFDDDDVQRRADELFDDMVESAMQEVDWDEYIGEPVAIEEEIEVEEMAPAEEEDVDPDLGIELGDMIEKTVTKTVYYPGVQGGYRKRRARGDRPAYGVESRGRREVEQLEDNEGYYETEAAAEKAAREILDSSDIKEDLWDRVYEDVRDGLDYTDAEDEARRELAREHDYDPDTPATGGRYGEYVLEPAAEPGSYREFFLTAPNVPYSDLTLDEISKRLYGKPFSGLTEQWQRDGAMDTWEENKKQFAKGASHEWVDGHSLYNDIENPILRIRFNVRRAIVPKVVDQAAVAAGKDAEVERKALMQAHGLADESALAEHLVRQQTGEAVSSPFTDAEVERLDELNQLIIAADKASKPFLLGEKMLFIEEMQPPRPEQQRKMPAVFLNRWRELGFKWALHQAAAQGLAGIAWTTGAQQAERYSLAKRVKEIRHGNIIGKERPELTRYVVLDLIGHGALVLHLDAKGVVRHMPNNVAGSRAHEQFMNEPLSAIIGEERATEIMASTEDDQVITGAQLKVGGQGLTRLYDHDFKNVVNGLPAIKKHGGRVGTVTIPIEHELSMLQPTSAAVDAATRAAYGIPPEWSAQFAVIDDSDPTVPPRAFDTYAEAHDYMRTQRLQPTEQPALILTPELNREILGGQSLFQPQRYVPKTAAEMESLNAQVTALVDAERQRAPGIALDAHVDQSGTLFITAVSDKSAMQALLKWADDHNLMATANETALGLKPFAFVENGSGAFYDAAALGQFVRPARAFRRGANTKRQHARGAITFEPNRKTTITLFESANLSTFLHETGHFYLEMMGDLVDQLDRLDPATLTREQQQLRADYGTILKHLGISSRADIDVEQHELFARSFEAYLMEGKAPSLALRDAFRNFRAWLVGLYRSLKTLNAPLSDDIRKVFDRLLATDEEIEQAKNLGQLQAAFLTPEAAGMSHERFALYRDVIEQANAAATEELDQRLMAEVQREQTAVWKAQRAVVLADVKEKTHALPVYRALYAMRKGTEPNGAKLPAPEGETPGTPLKLARSIVIERYGEARLKTLPKGLVAESGLDPDVVADLYGYGSGDSMLQAVSAAPPMQQVIKNEVERRMIVEHGSLLLDGTLAERAQLANANEMREAVLREELRALAEAQRKHRPVVTEAVGRERREREYERRWFEAEAKLRVALAEGRKDVEIEALQREVSTLRMQARSMPSAIRGALPTMQVARDAARQVIADTKISELNPQVYWARMRRASVAATDAAARQDFDAAVQHKTDEIIALSLYREMMRVKQDVEQRVRAAKKLGDPKSLARLMKAGETYHDQVAGILDRFEFADVPRAALERRSDLNAWVKSQEDRGLAVDLPAELLNEAKRANYKQLTVNELVGITDGLKQILHLSRLKNRLLKSQAARDLKKVAATIVSTIYAHNALLPKQERIRTTKGERRRDLKSGLLAHRKLASMVRELDGLQDNGPMWNAVMRPLNEAADREAEMNADATTRYAEIIERAYPGAQKRLLFEKAAVPAVNETMTKMERLMIALNWGNEGGRDRIKNYQKWTDGQVQAVLDTLDRRDMVFVQEVLDLIGSYGPEIQAKSRRLTGVSLEMVEAVPIKTAVGTFPGGYFPLKYDDRINPKAASALDIQAAGLAKAAAFVQATTARGHEKTRVETYDAPVLLDFGVISTHLQQVIHDLSHHEALIDVSRVLGQKDVREAIFATKGDQFERAMRNTVRDVAFGQLPAADGIERAINHTRVGSTIVGIAWNFSTAALQFLGLANSIVRLGGAVQGTKWLGAGFKDLLGSPKHMQAQVEAIYKKSVMMRTRALTMNRETNEVRNKVGVYDGQFSTWVEAGVSGFSGGLVTKQAVVDSYFYMIQKMQQMVDVPTWQAGYLKAIESGVDEATAIALADQTVLDSQGGGNIKDLAGVQRGTPMMKLWTNFYSFFSVLYNQAVEAGKAPKRNVSDIGRTAADYMLLFIIPATLSHLLRDAMKAGDEGGDDPLWQELIVANLTYMMGTMIGVREFGGSVEGYYGYSGPAGARVFKAGSGLIKQMQQLEFDEALGKALFETAGVLFHFPTGQVQRTTTGIAAMIEGRTSNPLALVTGPPKE